MRRRGSEREGEYLSSEHGEGGSFVWQMRVDALMLQLHLVALNLKGRHVGMRGKWERKAKSTGGCGFDLTAAKSLYLL